MSADLNLLRVLLAIYETGNVTLAAQQLKMSQPATSAALARLRRSFDDPLFVRRDLRMEPTSLVQSIIQKTREVLDVIDRDILASATFRPLTYTGEFSFCLTEIGEVVLLPALYEHLKQVAPGARLKSISLAPRELDNALREGKVDLAIGYFPDLAGGDMYQQRLFSHDLACIVRKDHKIRGERMSLKQFCGAEHLLVRDGSRSLEMYERHIASRGVQRRIAMQTSHYMSVPALVERSDFVVVLPRTIAQLFAAEGKVRVVTPPADIPRYDLKQYWHRRFNNDPRGKWLRSAVQELFDGYLADSTAIARRRDAL
jgi:DNA-binding transcriptional LysR family regulator